MSENNKKEMPLEVSWQSGSSDTKKRSGSGGGSGKGSYTIYAGETQFTPDAAQELLFSRIKNAAAALYGGSGGELSALADELEKMAEGGMTSMRGGQNRGSMYSIGMIGGMTPENGGYMSPAGGMYNVGAVQNSPFYGQGYNGYSAEGIPGVYGRMQRPFIGEQYQGTGYMQHNTAAPFQAPFYPPYAPPAAPQAQGYAQGGYGSQGYTPGGYGNAPQLQGYAPNGYGSQGYAPNGYAPSAQGYAPNGYAPSAQGGYGASGGSDADAMQAAKLIGDIVNIVKYSTRCHLDTESTHYARFITHVQFFADRFFDHALLESKDDFLYQQIREAYPAALDCAEKVRTFFLQSRDTFLPNEEVAYLAIHVARLTDSM